MLRNLRQAARALGGACRGSTTPLPPPAWPPLPPPASLGRGGADWCRGFTASGTAHTIRPPPRDGLPGKLSFLQEAKPPGWGSAGGGLSPFTPTKDLVKRKDLFKRTAYIMQALEYEAAAGRAAARATPLPAFRPGDVLHVKLSVPENKRRPAEFRGLCIARRNRGLSSSFTLRSVIGSHALERSFPLHSPHVLDVRVVERRKVARAKLYFLRRKPLKFSRVGGGGAAHDAVAGEGGGPRKALSGDQVAGAAARAAAAAKAVRDGLV